VACAWRYRDDRQRHDARHDQDAGTDDASHPRRRRLAAGSAPRRATHRRAAVRRQCRRTDGVGAPLAADVGDQRVASRSLKPVVVGLHLVSPRRHGRPLLR